MTEQEHTDTSQAELRRAAEAATFALRLIHLRELLAAYPDPTRSDVRAVAVAIAEMYLRAGGILDLFDTYAQADAPRKNCVRQAFVSTRTFLTAALACALSGVEPTLTQIGLSITDPDMSLETRTSLGLPVSSNRADDHGLDARRANLTQTATHRAFGNAADFVDPLCYPSGRRLTPDERDQVDHLRDWDRTADLGARLTTIMTRLPLAIRDMLPAHLRDEWHGDIVLDPNPLLVAVGASGPGGSLRCVSREVNAGWMTLHGLSPKGVLLHARTLGLAFGYRYTTAVMLPADPRARMPHFIVGVTLSPPGRHTAQDVQPLAEGIAAAGCPTGVMIVNRSLVGDNYSNLQRGMRKHGYDLIVAPRAAGQIAYSVGECALSGDKAVDMVWARSVGETTGYALRSAPHALIAKPLKRHYIGYGKHAIMLAIEATAVNIRTLADYYADDNAER